MADNSPAFTPPLDRLIDEDSQIVKVPMDHTGAGFRKSQQSGVGLSSADMAIKTIPNSGSRR